MSRGIHWWLLGRTFLGQPAFGPAVLVWVHNGELHAVGPTGNVLFQSPTGRLTLDLSSLGNLKITSDSGATITLTPAQPQGTPAADRMLRHLPREVATGAAVAQPHSDPLLHALGSAFQADASGPTREVASYLMAGGATLRSDQPYSRARVWMIAVGVIVAIVVVSVLIALLAPA